MRAGFTLIELLMTIAIIGILATVILTSLNDARQTGIDAKLQTEMDSIQKRAELEFSNGNVRTYHTVCGTGTFSQSSVIAGVITSIESFGGGTVTCNSSAAEYAVSVPLLTGGHWCVDSTGASDAIGAALTTQTACP